MENQTMGNEPDYSKERSYEKEAEAKLKNLSEKLVDDLDRYNDVLWLLGDGHGGYIFDVIKEEFFKRYGRPKKHAPERSKNITTKIRRLVFERDAYRCVKCKTHLNLCVDHIYPWSKGGGDDIANLQTLCRYCNAKKKDRVEVVQ